MLCRDYLDRLRDAAGLLVVDGHSLRPVAATNILSVERVLGRSLPDPYKQFLSEVGTGYEPGKLGEWLSCDITRERNLVAFSQDLQDRARSALRQKRRALSHYPAGMLAIFDSLDGEIYGFVPCGPDAFCEHIVAFDQDALTTRVIASNFDELLSALAANFEIS